MYIIEYLDTSSLPKPQQWQTTLKTDTSRATYQRLEDFGAVPFGAKVRQRLAGNGLEAPTLQRVGFWFVLRVWGKGSREKKHKNMFG